MELMDAARLQREKERLEIMNVLSLFDGMSCGQLALERAGIKYDNYFASEIEPNAIKVTMKNYPNTIQLGDVTKWREWELPKIDLLIGGSPCQSLSITQSKTRQNLDGKSKLFYEFVDVLQNTNPKYFLFENVASMTEECKEVITSLLRVEPHFIDSNCFSAQDRPRYYWTNLDIKEFGKNNDVLRDIMQDNVADKYFYNCGFDYHGDKKVAATLHIKGHDILKRVHSLNFKSHTLTTCGGGNTQKKVIDGGRPRKLTPLEYERLQKVPDNYTDCVADTHRYNMLGNGWTVDVIAHIFKGLKEDIINGCS
jgi:DNA (cytosine-5)-methyltransferase 3A